MNNAQKKVVLVFIILLAVVLVARPYLQKGAAESYVPAAVLLQDAFETGKPLALIFTYNAECCPDTDEFFTIWEQHVNALLEQNSQIHVVWLNVGSESQDDQQAIMQAARDYEVTHIPSLLLLDSEKRKVELLVGEFDRNQALAAMEGL